MVLGILYKSASRQVAAWSAFNKIKRVALIRKDYHNCLIIMQAVIWIICIVVSSTQVILLALAYREMFMHLTER